MKLTGWLRDTSNNRHNPARTTKVTWEGPNRNSASPFQLAHGWPTMIPSDRNIMIHGYIVVSVLDLRRFG
jgi:hypothetical protein